MALELESFNDPTLDRQYVEYLLDQESVDAAIHFGRLWDYFLNPLAPAAGVAADALNTNSRPYFQAQELGLPARITGINRSAIGGEELARLARKEVVIENDIAWRVQTGVEFLAGRPINIRSLAADPAVAGAIESIVQDVLTAQGGAGFLQEMVLLGSVYGFVDVVLRVPENWHSLIVSTPAQPAAGVVNEGSALAPPNEDAAKPIAAVAPSGQGPDLARSKTTLARARHLARQLSLEIVEATRTLPILADDDYRRIRYWMQCYRKQCAFLDPTDKPLASFGWGGRRVGGPQTVEVVEIIGPTFWQRYEDRQLVAQGENPLGVVPVVHIQNQGLPGSYEGLSDVLPLVPLQDELNTRLSDRASRVTYQSFRMYLAKGIDDFLERPVGPGQMWATHNPDASIQEFGSDGGSPSEDAHIEQVRQAMDKASGVTGLAAGLVRGNVGNLTSATALRVLLSGLLARTERKRLSYGHGLQQIVELVLAWLDRTGVFRTRPDDRRIEIHWPSPLPEDQSQKLADARIKAELGVPAQRILAELGYDRQTAGTAE